MTYYDDPYSYEDQREIDAIMNNAQSEFEDAAADLADAEEATDRQEQQQE